MRSRYILFIFSMIFIFVGNISFAENNVDRYDVELQSKYYSIGSSKVNLRTGPGLQYPIDWVYRKVNYPVEVIDTFDVWRKVRDISGTMGWIHQAMLSSRRYGIVREKVYVKTDNEFNSKTVAILHPEVIVKVIECPKKSLLCEVEIDNIFGYIPKKSLWGVYFHENF